MFIQTEATPNPEVMKFIPGVKISSQPYEFLSAESAKSQSPLALALFAVEGVKSVFFGYDFITITKMDGFEWYVLKAPILGVIMEYYLTNQGEAVTPSTDESPDRALIYDSKDEGTVKEIIDLIESRVRPSVLADGGDIQFLAFSDGVVYVEMKGACSGCPSSSATLKAGVENLLRHFVPEVREVKQAYS